MKKLHFSFSTKLTFDDNVYNHSFALRCIPINNSTQSILNYDLEIKPFVSTKLTMDAFGNNVISGYIQEKHRYLDFDINGTAQIDSTIKTNDYLPCYLYQSKYTKPNDELKAFYNDIANQCRLFTPADRAAYFSQKLFDCMTYEKNITNTQTEASDAFKIKKGVCQDYSHIMLSLLRIDKIPCRYIAGLSSCAGETHSWIEFWDGNGWIGLDPANNCFVTDDYLILTQGRDFMDCSIDRGVMFGSYTRQMQLITSTLEQQ
ncbi:MAG: transglutaminase family protein [Ruminococcus sp.]|nr:transglutaminase family protein [Ruminococcus sp.]